VLAREMATTCLLGGCSGSGDGAPAGPRTGSEQGGSTAGFEAATRDDAGFRNLFRHELADVDGVRRHYVTGDTGDSGVLPQGWPQTWFEWRDVLPARAEHHAVYALDLPGPESGGE
jgi:hypothetical protein